MDSLNLVGYHPCCLYLFWGSSYLWFGSLFKLSVHPFTLSASFFEHFTTFRLKAILLFFWCRPGNMPLSEIWFLSVEKWYLENKVWTLVVLIASGMPMILASQDGEFRSMCPIPIQPYKLLSSFFTFYIFFDVRNITGLFFHSTPMPSTDGLPLPTRLKKKKGK